MTTLDWLKLGWVLAAIVIAGGLYLYGQTANANRIWRRCTQCQRYFDDEGYTTGILPLGRVVPGMCKDCAKDLEFRG
jgi:hypothetical protein